MWNSSALKPQSPHCTLGKAPHKHHWCSAGAPQSCCQLLLGCLLWQEVAGAWGSWCLCFPVPAAPGEARAHEQPVRGGVCRGLPALAVVSLVAVLPHVWRRRWVPACPPAPHSPAGQHTLHPQAQVGSGRPWVGVQSSGRASSQTQILQRRFWTLSGSWGGGCSEHRRLFSKYSKVKNAT